MLLSLHPREGWQWGNAHFCVLTRCQRFLTLPRAPSLTRIQRLFTLPRAPSLTRIQRFLTNQRAPSLPRIQGLGLRWGGLLGFDSTVVLLCLDGHRVGSGAPQACLWWSLQMKTFLFRIKCHWSTKTQVLYLREGPWQAVRAG